MLLVLAKSLLSQHHSFFLILIIAPLLFYLLLSVLNKAALAHQQSALNGEDMGFIHIFSYKKHKQ